MTDQSLKRSLSLPLITAYGLGTILGAGIYVLIGEVARETGPFMPVSFLLAGVVASFSAFSYAALGSRFPQSAGEAVYVHEAFSWTVFTKLIGFLVVLIGIISSATIAKGFAGYLNLFFDVTPLLASIVLVLSLGILAGVGISESVWVATAITVVEILGLLIVIVVTAPDVPGYLTSDARLIPGTEWRYWGAITSGAFLAFFAFIGFEDMVNVAEEVRDPVRNLPRAIILALLISTVLYTLLAICVVATASHENVSIGDTPLATVAALRGIDPKIMGAIGILAIVNGALVQIIMGSRVLFGMARKGWLPQWFGNVSSRTQTPVIATALVTVMIVVFVIWLPLVQLASVASFITLLVFAAINAALFRIQLGSVEAPGDSFRVPQWVPVIGFALCSSLAVIELL